MPPLKHTHQTDWCCWYIHGRQTSKLVIAGPPSATCTPTAKPEKVWPILCLAGSPLLVLAAT